MNVKKCDVRVVTPNEVSCDNVCVAAPDGLVLLEQLSFCVKRGESLLVVTDKQGELVKMLRR